MENFFSDEEKPASSKANSSSPSKESKNDYLDYKLPQLSPLPSIPKTENKDYSDYKVSDVNNPFPKGVAKDETLYNSGLTQQERGRVGEYFRGEDTQKLLYNSQSNWERTGNLLTRMGANIVGGTISSLGSVPAVVEGIYDEVRGQDADFTNSITELGDQIKQVAKKNFPNYKENNESWNVSDPAWWFEGVESAASTLEFLAGSYGAIKGVGAVSRLLRVEKALASMGANVEGIKLGAKIATGAMFSRNAENMMESFQLVKDTKDDLLKQWTENPEEFEKLRNDKIGKELAAEGREVTPETLAKFIAGKAGWQAYAINSTNIVFDAIQMVPLVKGFNPSTRIGGLGTRSAISAAERQVLNQGARGATLLDKTFDVLNPIVSGVGRSLTEGIEEAVNYVGTHQGQNLVKEVTNKPLEDMDLGKMTEAAFWGTFGGAVYQGVSGLMNKRSSNLDDASRIEEIQNRINILDETSKEIKKINEDDSLNDEDKKSAINKVKAESEFDMYFRAYQNGNGNGLENMVRSKEYRDKLIDLGISDQVEIDKSIAKSLENGKAIEQSYKDYYNSFYTAKGSTLAKSALIRNSTLTDYFIKKNAESINTLNGQLETLKASDQYISTSSNKDLENLIYSKGLRKARKSIEDYVSYLEYDKSDKNDKLDVLSERGKQELSKLDERITQIEEQTKNSEKLDFSKINPRIIEKQAEIILKEKVNSIQSEVINENRKQSTIDQVDNQIQEIVKNKEEEEYQDFVKSLEGEKTSKELEDLLPTYKNDKRKSNYLKDRIKSLKDKEKTEKAVGEVSEAIDTSSPVNDSTTDIFPNLPHFENKPVDPSIIDPAYKKEADEAFNSQDEFRFQGITGDSLFSVKPNEVQYARNKVQELREKSSKSSELVENNSNPNHTTEFEYNEEIQESSQNEKSSDTIPSFEQINEKDEIDKISDPETRRAKQIEYILKSIAGAIGEASTNKVKEYVNRIRNGESRESIVSGLSKSFVENIDRLLNIQPDSKEVIKDTSKVKVGDRLSFIDGKKGTITSIENNLIVVKLDNGAEFKANPKVIEVFKEEDIQTDSDTLFDFLSKDFTEGSIGTYIPVFGIGLQNFNKKQFFHLDKNNIVMKKEWEDTVKSLMSSDLNIGDEIEIVWDKNNSVTSKEDQQDKMNAAFKIMKNGVRLAYLPAIKTTLSNLETLKRGYAKTGDLSIKNTIDRIELELPHTIRLREQLELSDKVFKTKLLSKGNGTVLSRGFDRKYRSSVKGKYEDFFALDPNSVLEARKLINISNSEDSFSSVNRLGRTIEGIFIPNQGKIYGKQKNAVGKFFPVPLFVNNINLVQAKEIQKDILDLLNLLNQGLDTENQTVKDIKDKIAKYISVDRSSNYEKAIGFRVYPSGTNKNGEKVDPRIVMSYYNSKGEKLQAVMKIGQSTGKSRVWIFDSKGKEVKSDIKGESLTIENPIFLDILRRKTQNVDFKLLSENKSFNYNGKTYKSYKDYLIEEEVIQTDVADVIDSKGNKIGNLFGSNNDFVLSISSDLIGSKSDLKNMSKSYKGELDNLSEDYKKNYSLFSSRSTNPKQIIKEILSNPLNDNIKEVANLINKNLNKFDCEIILSKDLKKHEDAIYSSHDPNNTIRFNENKSHSEVVFQELVLHELLHAITSPVIIKSLSKTISTATRLRDEFQLTDIESIGFKPDTPNYIVDFVTGVLELRNEAIEKLTSKYGMSSKELGKLGGRFYGLQDPFEFISNVMTKPDFRRELQNLESEENILERFYNSLVDLINKIFGTKFNKTKDSILKRAVNHIKNSINSIDNIEPLQNVDIVNYSKTDIFDNRFSRVEILETINNFEGNITNFIRNRKTDINSLEELSRNSKMYDELKYEFFQYNQVAPESVKEKSEEVYTFFDQFYSEAIRKLKRDFRKIDELEEVNNEEVEKAFESTSEQQYSSQDSITNQIKLFIRTIPELNSLETSKDEKGNIIWDNKKSTMTGRASYIDFNVVYPYLIRNIIGAKSGADIISRLTNMSKVNASFAYIADQLKKDANLLAQFESNLAKKYIYDSYVTFITNKESGRDIWISSELRNTKHDYRIFQKWIEQVDALIEENENDKDKKVELDIKINKIYLDISKKAENFINNKEAIANDLFNFGNLIGVDLSYLTILGDLENKSELKNSSIFNSLEKVYGTIRKGKKNDAKSWLGDLARKEAVIDTDIVENSGIDIKGNPIFAIRNPNFISNWFTMSKSDTEEGRQEFKTYLWNLSKIPSMQMSNILWNSSIIKGLLNFEMKDGIKVPISVNWEYVENFNFHNFGGAKELITKQAQSYTEFSDKDWMLVNLINFIRPTDKSSHNKGEKEWVYIPSIIPSDSSSMYTFEVAKIRVRPQDIIKTKNSKGKITRLSIKRGTNLSNESPIFIATYKTALQEVKRIQQATEKVFDIIDNKLAVKKDLDLSKLQQYYHYGKSYIYNKDGSVNLEETFLKNGNPSGNAFYFTYMNIEENGKVISLEDLDIKNNGHLEAGELGIDSINKIKDFTEKFINSTINTSYNDFRSLETELLDKHKSISDGTFENLISEYSLNSYIYNVEQFNLFNGNLAEFKNVIESNKRAKQMFAPGIGLSTDFMKMQYENGNWSDGSTFRGVTIKDFKLSAKDITLMSDRIRKKLLQDRPNRYGKKISFNIRNIINQKPESKLEKDIFNIVKPYFDINAGDAQGYSTLDRREQILRGRGEFNSFIEDTLNKARKGTLENLLTTPSLQSLKGFYYGREYDNFNNNLTSNQIKYSSLTLTPQLVKGTELEKLMNWMNKNNIEEVFFESAHKVGAKQIFKIHNEDGTINEEELNKSIPNTFYNKNYSIQLDVPEHLLDTENVLATQISKLIIGNINPEIEYKVESKTYKGKKLIEHYFRVLNDNIEESASMLLKELNINREGDFLIVKDSDLKKVLDEEVKKRGLSDNYRYAIELDRNGDFKLPLFINSMSTKWEAILTSIFTNQIIKQKLPGGSVVLGSRVFLDNNITQSESSITGIEWSKEKEADKTLRSYTENEGKIQVVEVLMSAWNSELFKENQRINIDEVPEEVKKMIAYRIPTTSKAYMTVFKVVGFLPEVSRGTIITPDDMIVQMGQDFDIDKWFIMYKNFYINDNKEFIVPTLGKEKKEFESLLEERKKLREFLKLEEDQKYSAEGSLIGDIFGMSLLSSSEEESKSIRDRLTKINERLKQITIYNSENNLTLWKEEGSRQSRQNEIFNIYESILTNEDHFKEIVTPSGYFGLTALKDEINEITKSSDSINPLTEKSQRTFRKRNIAGKSLTAIAANLNSFGAIAQVSRMILSKGISFKFKFNLDNYNLEELIDRYQDDIQLEQNSATIQFSNLGFSPDDSYLNVDGELILDTASEGVVAAVDNAKDPVLDTINLTTYTYPTYHTGILAGVPIRLMGMFIRQPIIKNLNDYFFETKSILGDISGEQVSRVKKYYQTILYEELLRQGKTEANEKMQKTLDRRDKDGIINSYDKKYLIYIERKDIKDILKYDPDSGVFSVEDLKSQLELNSKGWTKMTDEEKLDYLKTQLQILEQFNSYEKAGRVVQDVLRATKTDSIGAGPSMDITTELIRNIEKLKDNDNLTINDQPAIQAIYPSHFELDQESAYSPLETYLNLGNKLSVEILGKKFITQSRSFKDVIYTINNIRKPYLNEEEIKLVNKFLSTNILQDFEDFRIISREKVLGLYSEVNKDLEIDFNFFKNLSVANKVYIMQQKYREYLKQDPQHVLNFLLPQLDKIKENGYHKIDVVFYKNEMTDDNIADSIFKMYETGTNFEKNLTHSLIEYSFVTNGLSFGLQSFSKMIPNRILYETGLGDYLRRRQLDLTETSIFDIDTIDKFFKNNYSNSSLVPSVRTRWDYITEDVITKVKSLADGVKTYEQIGKQSNLSEENIRDIFAGKTSIIRTNKDGEKYTKDSTPIWDSSQSVLGISERSIKNMGDTINSPYISIYSESGVQLYKKYVLETEDENDKIDRKSSFNGIIYYYKVNKLGKDGVYEFTNNSIFEDNNIELSEAQNIASVENLIYQIEQNRIKNLELNNTSKAKEEEIINNCKIPGK